MQNSRGSTRPVLLTRYVLIGSEMVGFTVTGVFLDWLTTLTPWLTVSLTLVGLLVAMMHLVKMSRKQMLQ